VRDARRNFFNNGNYLTPPDWRIKPLTQDFILSLQENQIEVYKIARAMNVTAHSLAKQAHRMLSNPPLQAIFSCTNNTHVN
jgi:hypothetical protein